MWKHISIFILITALIAAGLFWLQPEETETGERVFVSHTQLDDFARYVHAGYFVQSARISSVRDDFQKGEQLRVLIVPGHTDEHPGALYRGVREVDMTYTMADALFRLLKQDDRFYVELAGLRDEDQNAFKSFYENQHARIVDFELYQKAISEEIKNVITEYDYQQAMIHNVAPRGIAAQLYGINVYATDNNFDLVLHIHFNDYARSDHSQPGKYTGYALYVPNERYSNSSVSFGFAQAIADELDTLQSVSTHPLEAAGIVEDSELIAIGAHNTARVPAILMEYGYMYEDVFQDEDAATAFMDQLAAATKAGIVNFVE